MCPSQWRKVTLASNGGRGLKHHHPDAITPSSGHARQQWRARIETEKPQNRFQRGFGHARQQWRARIETSKMRQHIRWRCCHARQQWRARIETRCPEAAAQARWRHARQQWRARIETSAMRNRRRLAQVTLASNGGRGLKRLRAVLQQPAACHARQQWRARIETTTAATQPPLAWRHARQQWRARIETTKSPLDRPVVLGHARQQWRARIETFRMVGINTSQLVTLASNGGRGLKHRQGCGWRCWWMVTLASNGGRGLKHPPGPRARRPRQSRSPAMAGAD